MLCTKMEPKVGIGPTTYALPRRCSATEPLGQDSRKGVEGHHTTDTLRPLQAIGGQGWIRTTDVPPWLIYSQLPSTN